MIINIKKKTPTPSIVFDTYWKFASLRQNIFFDRIKDYKSIIDDPILQKHKFTNAYRASDRVSQYLIKNVIYEGSQDFKEVFLRTILFKIFNKISTWELLIDEIGEVTTQNFQFKNYSKKLSEAVSAKETIYSGAYIMASGKSTFGYNRKFENHLKLIELMLKEQLPERILAAKTLEQVFNLLKNYPTIGNFLAFQFAIDLNYSANLSFSEMDFVVPGPGAKDGIRKCFSDYGDYSETDIIQYVTDNQQQHFERLGLDFKDLWGRTLQLIDCQNLFCETDKYARLKHPKISGLSDRKRIKQIYRPNTEKINYWYPPKWGINERIK
jgi:alpha-glutamyl/putrescinyl thymine pyrophosphorylase clade 1